MEPLYCIVFVLTIFHFSKLILAVQSFADNAEIETATHRIDKLLKNQDGHEIQGIMCK